MVKWVKNCMRADNLGMYDKLAHGFYGRQGGASKHDYHGLNVGRGSNDNKADIEKNIAHIANDFQIQKAQIIFPYQTHSNICCYVGGDAALQNLRPNGDAIVTDCVDIMLAIVTADCCPVLFYDTDHNIIGAAHAGWRGAFCGILENTVKKMCEYGANIQSIKASTGPCIQQKSYEVDEGFYNNFLKESNEYKAFFKEKIVNNKILYHFDLPRFVAFRLHKIGISDIEISYDDSYSNKELFFSYRYSSHHGLTGYGRQFSGIMMRP